MDKEKEVNQPKRSEPGSLQYKMVLGVLIAAMLLGIVFCVIFFDPKDWLFWFFVAWTAFYAIAVYCWTDEERYVKFEYYGAPVMYGLLFLFLLLFIVAGLARFLPPIFAGEDILGNIAALIISELSLGFFAWFIWKGQLRDYFRKEEKTGEKREKKKK